MRHMMLKLGQGHPAIASLAIILLVLFALADLSGLARAHAQSGGGYALDWYTIDGGGYILSAGGGYSLGGTIGQPDAGAPLMGGSYILVGGFWGGSVAQYKIYLPTVLKSL